MVISAISFSWFADFGKSLTNYLMVILTSLLYQMVSTLNPKRELPFWIKKPSFRKQNLLNWIALNIYFWKLVKIWYKLPFTFDLSFWFVSSAADIRVITLITTTFIMTVWRLSLGLKPHVLVVPPVTNKKHWNYLLFLFDICPLALRSLFPDKYIRCIEWSGNYSRTKHSTSCGDG